MRVKVLFVLVDSVVSSVESGELTHPKKKHTLWPDCCVFQVSFFPVAQWPISCRVHGRVLPSFLDLREGHWGKCRPCRFTTAQFDWSIDGFLQNKS